MSILSVTVEEASQAFMLADWLKNICFVREVNIVPNDDHISGNVHAVQQMLDAIKTADILANIEDPVSYQNAIRDEWN